jgi:hypothetical protein
MEVDELKKDESELKHHRRQSLLKYKGGAAPTSVSDSDLAAAGLAGGRAPMDGLAEAEEEEAEVNGGEEEQGGEDEEEEEEGEDWDDDEEFDGELRVTEKEADALMQASDANAKDELAKLSTTAAAWTMLQDPSLGTLYYYNKITEQVTSEMPESWVERNRLIAEALAIVPDEASVGGDDGGAGTLTAKGGSGGRGGLEAAENMMPPEVDMVHVMDGEGGDEAEDGELDADWEEFSDDDGRAYYFNTKTDETTYDRPVKGEAGSDDGDDDEIYTRTSVWDGTGEEEGGGDEKEVAMIMEAVEEEEEEDEAEDAGIGGAAEDGEDGDESGGEDISECGDTGGDNRGGDEIQEEGRDENAAAGGCDDDATAEEEVKECVPGRERRWSTYQDDDGDDYYHNEITNETTYAVPEEFVETNGEEGGDATGDADGGVADEDLRRRIGARPMDDEGGAKDDSGNDSGGSGDDTANGSNSVGGGEGGGGGGAGHPPASTEEEDTNERVIPPSFSTQAESEAWFKEVDGLASDDHGILLPGWKSFDTEDGTNKLYYHNDATGETVWKRPGIILPFHWESRQDDDGQVYYVHDESEESVWELPMPQYVCECRGAGG